MKMLIEHPRNPILKDEFEEEFLESCYTVG